MPKEWFRMKLKKASIYLLSFLSLCIMFSACYYLSYLHALSDFNKKSIERKEQLYYLAEQAKPSQAANQNTNDDSITTDKTVDTVQPTTEYTLETYDMKTGTTQSEVLNPPAYLVGLTREEIIEYLADYMRDLPLSEYNKGLLSYELVNFSKDKITIKKTYNEDFLPYLFYVVVKEGYVVVYNSDLKSVFKYTQIEAKNLPEKDRIALIKGIYVNSLDDLYALLESYTS